MSLFLSPHFLLFISFLEGPQLKRRKKNFLFLYLHPFEIFSLSKFILLLILRERLATCVCIYELCCMFCIYILAKSVYWFVSLEFEPTFCPFNSIFSLSTHIFHVSGGFTSIFLLVSLLFFFFYVLLHKGKHFHKKILSEHLTNGEYIYFY